MEHTFFIYYPKIEFKLEPLIKSFAQLKFPLNRAGVSTGSNTEITRFCFDPFNEEFEGLQVTFLFANNDKRWNKLEPENINDLSVEFEFEQVCYLHYNDIKPWEITKKQIDQVELIFKIIGKSGCILIYCNGHQHYNLNIDNFEKDKEKLLNQINKEWN